MKSISLLFMIGVSFLPSSTNFSAFGESSTLLQKSNIYIPICNAQHNGSFVAWCGNRVFDTDKDKARAEREAKEHNTRFGKLHNAEVTACVWNPSKPVGQRLEGCSCPGL